MSPEQTTLYRLLQQHAAGSIVHTEAIARSELPRRINDEFDAFLEWALLSHDSLRPRSPKGAH